MLRTIQVQVPGFKVPSTCFDILFNVPLAYLQRICKEQQHSYDAHRTLECYFQMQTMLAAELEAMESCECVPQFQERVSG